MENILQLVNTGLTQSTLGKKSKSIVSAIADLLEQIEKDGQDVQQKFQEILGKRLLFEEMDSEFQIAGELLGHVHITFKTLALNLGVVYDQIGKGMKIIEVLKTLIKAVSLTFKSIKHLIN
jgi:hypothetical protein